MGFQTRKIFLPSDIGADPRAGVAQSVGGDRYDVLGTLGPASGPSLLLNGHIDVVPADSLQRWSSPPFEPRREGQRIFGRGAGDMKCGFAMGTLALRALLEVFPQFLTGPLSFLAVIEEECTGNGTLAAASQGVLADAVVLLEPTDLDVMLGGVGVMWCDIDVVGHSTHAESAHLAINPVDLVYRLVEGLRRWSDTLRDDYPDAALAAAAAIVNQDGGFPVEPLVRLSGFRAPGYLLADDHPLTRAMVQAHAQAHGVEPRTFAMGSTTDARIYLNYFDVPALCYGPAASNIHGID